MPVDVAIPEENAETAEERGEDHQQFRDALEEMKQVERCLLFTPGPDFAIACSCNDCRLKITELEQFEEDIKSTKELVLNYLGQLGRDESLCLILMSTAHWTIDILDLLFQQLEPLSEKTVQLPLKIEDPEYPKMRVVYLEMVQMLKDNGLIHSTEPPECDPEAYALPIAYRIDSGIYYYKQTKANIKAFDLLQSFAEIEQKKVAEEKMLDAAIYKGLIERQIELIKQLPMEDLYFEAQELIPKVCPVDENRLMVRDATVYIAKTNRAIIRKRKSFWRQFQAHPSSEDMASEGTGNKHNGLDKTLNLLLTMVDVFKSHWDGEYDPFFTGFGRSDRKRQRTVGS